MLLIVKTIPRMPYTSCIPQLGTMSFCLESPDQPARKWDVFRGSSSFFSITGRIHDAVCRHFWLISCSDVDGVREQLKAIPVASSKSGLSADRACLGGRCGVIDQLFCGPLLGWP